MQTVETIDFFRILLDWLVFQDLEQSEDPYALKEQYKSAIELLVQKSAKASDIYFYEPSKVPLPGLASGKEDAYSSNESEDMEFYKSPLNEKLVSFALTEIFNFYARKYTESKLQDFEELHNGLFNLGLRGYIAFVNDMKIPVDKPRVILVWKKAGKNHQPHKYEDFRHSLSLLGKASVDYRIETAQKKLKSCQAAIQHQERPLPNNLKAFDKLSDKELRDKER